MAAAAGLALAVGAGGAGSPREGAKNCGIVGVVSSVGKGGEGGVVEFLYEVRGAGRGGVAKLTASGVLLGVGNFSVPHPCRRCQPSAVCCGKHMAQAEASGV